MKRVTFLKSPSGPPYNLAYFIGDETDLHEDLAAELEDKKFVEILSIPGEEAEAAELAAAEAEKAAAEAAELAKAEAEKAAAEADKAKKKVK